MKSGWSKPHLGVLDSDRSQVTNLTALRPDIFSSFASLVNENSPDLGSLIRSEMERNYEKIQKFPLAEVKLTIPFEPSEVWAAGVTYLRSRQAREVETSLKGLYNYIYDAKRPELFLKTSGLRCVGPEEEVGIRGDSKWSVPEPELTLVLGHGCEVIGYTIGNDMSARDIEGENPLYLPQAKVYRKCCALGPVVTTRDEIPDPMNLQIDMKISRSGETVFVGSISTSQMKRTMKELVSSLKAYNEIPACSAFMTGTGIVPPDDFTLMDEDIIEIGIEGIGKLRNTARVLS